jgi:drug/metabolite transporter (DMT)-like permease
LVTLFSRAVVGESVPRALFGWSLGSILGVGLVVAQNYDDASRSAFGDLMALCNLLLYTGFFLLTKRARQLGATPLTLTTSSMALGLLMVTPFALFSGLGLPQSVVPRSAPLLPDSGREWALLAALALGPGNGHLLVNWAHSRVSAALGSLVLSAIPLAASFWAHLIFDEPYGVVHVVGALIVALSVEGGRRAAMASARLQN